MASPAVLCYVSMIDDIDIFLLFAWFSFIVVWVLIWITALTFYMIVWLIWSCLNCIKCVSLITSNMGALQHLLLQIHEDQISCCFSSKNMHLLLWRMLVTHLKSLAYLIILRLGTQERLIIVWDKPFIKFILVGFCQLDRDNTENIFVENFVMNALLYLVEWITVLLQSHQHNMYFNSKCVDVVKNIRYTHINLSCCSCGTFLIHSTYYNGRMHLVESFITLYDWPRRIYLMFQWWYSEKCHGKCLHN